MNALGTHLLLELKDCDPQILDDMAYLRNALIEATREVGATIVGDSFHHFRPQGVTGVINIAESHLCIHTWPEHAYAAADIFTCGDSFDPRKAAELLVERVGARDYSVIELKRGILAQKRKSSSTT